MNVSILRIGVVQPNASGYAAGAAIVSVQRLTDGRVGRLAQGWSQQKPVTVTGDAHDVRFTTFALPGDGYYSASLRRPRGSDLTRECYVGSQQTWDEIIRLKDSPHEFLSWEFFAGNLPAAKVVPSFARDDGDSMNETLYRSDTSDRNAGPMRFSSKTTRSSRRGGIGRGIQRIVPSAPVSHQASFPVVKAAVFRSGVSPWDMGHDRLEAIVRFKNLPSTADFSSWRSDRNEAHALWEYPVPEFDEALLWIPSPDAQPHSAKELERYPRWLAFENGRNVDIVSVPWGWWGGRRSAQEEIRFMYDRSLQRRSTPGALSSLTMTLFDHRWFGLLQFLGSGRLIEAGEIYDDTPERALFEKLEAPLPAVAGAIVLVSRVDSVELQEWDDWLANLSHWFPQIPDGPILLGCRALQRAQSGDDVETAFRHLKLGMARGLPFFSASIRMLASALAQLGGNFSPEAPDLYARVAALASHADPSQPFTVLRFGR